MQAQIPPCVRDFNRPGEEKKQNKTEINRDRLSALRLRGFADEQQALLEEAEQDEAWRG